MQAVRHDIGVYCGASRRRARPRDFEGRLIGEAAARASDALIAGGALPPREGVER